MKLRTLLLFCSLALVSVCSTAHATLIGDNITMTYFYPNLQTPLQTNNVTVQTGIGELVTFFTSGPYGSQFTVNPEADSIEVNFLILGTFNAAPFNGLIITGIDDTIGGVGVASNIAGFSGNQVTVDPHSVTISFANLSVTPDSNFTVFLRTTATPIPDSGTSAALLGLSFLGLFGLRRKLELPSN